MNIEYKYPINSTVYYLNVESVPYKTICKTCLGDGFITRKDGQQLKCPVCKGENTYSDDGSTKEVVSEDIVDHIIIDIQNNSTKISYYLKNTDKIFDEIYLFDNSEKIIKYE